MNRILIEALFVKSYIIIGARTILSDFIKSSSAVSYQRNMVRVCYLLVFLSFFSPVLTFCPTLTNVVNNNKLSSRTKCSDRCSSTAINSLNNGFSEHSNYLQAISEKQQTPRQRRTKLSATNRIDRTRSRQKIPLRRWNLNRNGGPFGFDLNAEVWNGRVAQVSENVRLANTNIVRFCNISRLYLS